jgi:hypothetical protein
MRRERLLNAAVGAAIGAAVAVGDSADLTVAALLIVTTAVQIRSAVVEFRRGAWLASRGLVAAATVWLSAVLAFLMVSVLLDPWLWSATCGSALGLLGIGLVVIGAVQGVTVAVGLLTRPGLRRVER